VFSSVSVFNSFVGLLASSCCVHSIVWIERLDVDTSKTKTDVDVCEESMVEDLSVFDVIKKILKETR